MAPPRARPRRLGGPSRVLLLLAFALAPAGAARAQTGDAPGPVDLNVIVSHVSDSPGPIDPRAQELHNHLRGQFRYGSLEVLQTERMVLPVDQVGSLKLPNGRALRVRPMDVGDRGVLLAVSVEGTLETDLRVRNGRRVVIGGDQYRDGRLVISLEPSW